MNVTTLPPLDIWADWCRVMGEKGMIDREMLEKMRELMGKGGEDIVAIRCTRTLVPDYGLQIPIKLRAKWEDDLVVDGQQYDVVLEVGERE